MKSGFFDNTEVVSEDFARLVSGIVTSGVLNDSEGELKVTAGGGMKVSVAPGYCWIEGHFGKAEATETLNIDTASGSVGRIDRIVARCDYGSCTVSLVVLKGSEGAQPTPPPIVRDGTYYDLGLATVSVPAGTIEITDSLITDTRTDAAVCGGCLMRTGEVISLDGKADKTAVEEIDGRVTTNSADIAALKARDLVRKTFDNSSGSGTSSCTVTIPGELAGMGFLKGAVAVSFTEKYVDVSEERTYSYSGAGTFELMGVGDNSTTGIVAARTDGSGSRACSIKAAAESSGLKVTATASSGGEGYSTISISAAVSNIRGVFLS